MTDNDHHDDEYHTEARRQQKHSGPHLKLPEPFRLTGLGTPHTPVTLSYHGCLLTPSVDKNMRPYVDPPPTLRCSCAGELRLKLIEPADRTRQKQREIFFCKTCGREQTLLADRNPYMASHPHQEKRQRTDLL